MSQPLPANPIDKFIGEIKARKDLKEFVHHEEIPPREPSYAQTARPLMPEVKSALEGLGIKKLFCHQAEGIDLIREGRNVVIMTPTASGKSLIYNIPVVESLLEDPDARAMYLFPLKGLEQDQLKAFRELTDRLPLERRGGPAEKKGGRRAYVPSLSEIYDGDTTAYRRKKIRETPPAVVLTNPDMLHLAINAFHQKWERYLRNLKYVIIDEVHTYRGVFGSHVANVLRRLRRIANMYGSDPVFIACSATIANPQELTGMLTGLPFELVEQSGAPRGKRNFIFLNPRPEVSPYTIATRLFISSVRAGFKTIAFTRARKITELMHTWVNEAAPDLNKSVSSYRAGFLPEERREIEQKLFKGELSGVISTSALELGVDIGGLDVCILVGYPGTISSTWQRSGRVGRSGRDSLIVMVALADALDQYFMRNPLDFFRRNVEAAVLDPENKTILKSHLLCAAAEGYLKPGETIFDAHKYTPVLNDLEREGKIRHWVKGDIWYPRKRYPQMEVSIREAGEAYTIVKEDGKMLGESSSSRVLFDLHPGAVYLHKGVQYRVVRLDMGERKVFCRAAADINYYTRAVTNEETEIISTEDTLELNDAIINLGSLRVTERVTGYIRKHIHTNQSLGEFQLELPPSVFTTVGIWTAVDESITAEIKAKGYSVAGALHAAEHAAIATLPLFALCDRMDLGGLSYPFNPELGSAAIFIYDGHEGGVGLAKRGFECVRDWFASTISLMEDCPCEIACPSCTQDPKCGNNNEPLDKRGAVMILKRWVGKPF
ncbi:MAG: DEAD/DEAH box helicase [Deltaproteobacteria bacterium]|nr:DEAD/DEAH box helicase [Deltaproteobacteria bacterium]